MTATRKKILFIAEAATLAHVARPLVLSCGLSPDTWEVEFACSESSSWLLNHTDYRKHTINSISQQQFLAALANGTPLYSPQTLRQYVEEDLRLIDKVAPDLVVGDFRLSLSVSARLAKVPYATISNLYWSPYWQPPTYPVPSLPISRVLPLPLATLMFRMVRPLAFALHCSPLNSVRKQYGLPSLGLDLRRIYTDADTALYADCPLFFPGVSLPSNHRFIGPIIWSPPFPLPSWWDTLPEDRPVIYVTLGSSGLSDLLPRVLQALAGLDATVIAATAGTKFSADVPANAHIADYLPGLEAARKASLVICNGGSPTSQQALSVGTPVIGIAGNLDQFLNMTTLETAQVGKLLRGDRLNTAQLAAIAAEMIADPGYQARAGAVAETFRQNGSAESNFAAFVSELAPQLQTHR